MDETATLWSNWKKIEMTIKSILAEIFKVSLILSKNVANIQIAHFSNSIAFIAFLLSPIFLSQTVEQYGVKTIRLHQKSLFLNNLLQ